MTEKSELEKYYKVKIIYKEIKKNIYIYITQHKPHFSLNITPPQKKKKKKHQQFTIQTKQNKK